MNTVTMLFVKVLVTVVALYSAYMTPCVLVQTMENMKIQKYKIMNISNMPKIDVYDFLQN